MLAFFSSMLSGAGVVGEGVEEVPSSPFGSGTSIDFSLYRTQQPLIKNDIEIYGMKMEKGKERDIIKFGHRNGLQVRKLVGNWLTICVVCVV